MKQFTEKWKDHAKTVMNSAASHALQRARRDSGMVVLGGWNGVRFADNSKAFFLFLSENRQKLGLSRVAYAVRDKQLYCELKAAGLDVVRCGTRESNRLHRRALYHIVDCGESDVSRIFSVNAVRINLWHGFPLKRIGLLIHHDDAAPEELARWKRPLLGNWDDFYNLAMSEAQKILQQRAFGLRGDKMILGLYPRIAYLLGGIPRFYLPIEKEARQTLEKVRRSGKKIVSYFPTFRDKAENNSVCVETVRLLQPFLRDNGLFLLTKMHLASGLSAQGLAGDYVLNLPKQSDVNNFLDLADILITDYSSVYFDYLLLKRPVIFYCFDRVYYENWDRGFVFPYDEFTPGEKAENLQELQEALYHAAHAAETYGEKWEAVYRHVMDTVYDGKISDENSMMSLWGRIAALGEASNE